VADHRRTAESTAGKVLGGPLIVGDGLGNRLERIALRPSGCRADRIVPVPVVRQTSEASAQQVRGQEPERATVEVHPVAVHQHRCV
jgi:hypothetical protein